jgi:hypothetical protein
MLVGKVKHQFASVGRQRKLSLVCLSSYRESEKLQIAERMPRPRRLPMPAVSDMEINLRLNVPDGLETSGEWPYEYVTLEIDLHADSNE